jgi:hypothetical protein
MMKKKIFIPLLIAAMTVTMSLQAQVKIGKAVKPENGAILDLNAKKASGYEGYVGGLLLPTVEITSLDSIPHDFSDSFTLPERNVYSDLTGTVVYSFSPCPGIYVWDGGKWVKLGEPCPINR